LSSFESSTADLQSIRTYLTEQDMNNAEQLLSTIRINFVLNDVQSSNVDDFEFLISLANDGNSLKWSGLSESELSDLRQVSIKDSFVGAMARSILCYFYHECEESSIRYPEQGSNRHYSSSIPEYKSTNVVVSPNPADDNVTFSWSVLPQNCILKVLDNQGKEMLSVKLNGTSGIQSFNTQTFGQGMYIWAISSNSKVIESGKIEIIH
jgi:hypothetical protein